MGVGSVDFTALINPDAGGWAAFVVLVVSLVTSIARGWLVPRRTVDTLAEVTVRIEAVQAERLTESVEREREWRAAWLASEEARRLLADQVGDLLEYARTTDAFIRGLKQVAGGEHG